MEVGRSLRSLSALLALLAAAGCATYPAREPAADSQIRFFASNLLMRANGTFHAWKVTETHVDPGNVARSFVRVEVDLASIDTGIEARDEHLRSADFFDVETYPTAFVRVHSPEKVGTDENGDDRYRALFDIDLHGVEKTLPGEFVVRSREPLLVEGEIALDRLDFGIGRPSSFSNSLWLSEEVPVSFQIVLPP